MSAHARLAFELAERMQIQPEKYDLPWVAQLYADRQGGAVIEAQRRASVAQDLFVRRPAQRKAALLMLQKLVHPGA